MARTRIGTNPRVVYVVPKPERMLGPKQIRPGHLVILHRQKERTS
jgi:hypothetical protein